MVGGILDEEPADIVGYGSRSGSVFAVWLDEDAFGDGDAEHLHPVKEVRFNARGAQCATRCGFLEPQVLPDKDIAQGGSIPLYLAHFGKAHNRGDPISRFP